MPAKSKAQANFARFSKAHPNAPGAMPPSVANEFIPHGKGSMKKLPTHVKHKK